ncbi:hypothetical protein JCM16814_30040 [Desulfobaculum senezii]
MSTKDDRIAELEDVVLWLNSRVQRANSRALCLSQKVDQLIAANHRLGERLEERCGVRPYDDDGPAEGGAWRA